MWPLRKRESRSTRLQSVTVAIPWVGSASFVPDETEAKAAWSIYVEIVTRVPIQPGAQGSLREGLNSVYEMFGAMREILRESGPRIAHGKDSLAPLALGVLNSGLRPFLSEWHTRLLAHESARGPFTDQVEHEQGWGELEGFIKAQQDLKEHLDTYARQLLKIAGAEVGDT